MKQIEKKLNDISFKNSPYYTIRLFEYYIIGSIIYTYETFKKENKLNYTVIKNLRKIKLNANFSIEKGERFFTFVQMSKFLNGEINNNLNNKDKNDYYEIIILNHLKKRELPLPLKNLENNDIFFPQSPFKNFFLY